MPRSLAPSLPSTVAPGQLRVSRDRVIKNGGWVFVTGASVHPAGGGDLSLQDLDDIAAQLGPADAFLALPEDQAYPFRPNGQYPRLIDLVRAGDIDAIAARADFAVFQDGVFAVDHYDERKRRGLLAVRPGYSVTSTLRIISRAPIQMPALSTGEVLERLHLLTAATA